MESAIVLQALLLTWDELPALLGLEWAELFPRLEALLDRLEHAQSLGEKKSLVAELMMLFHGHSQARKHLHAVMGDLEQDAIRTRGAEPTMIPLPENELADASRALQGVINAPTMTRYTDITAPRYLALGQREAITVRLTCIPQTDNVDTTSLEVSLANPLEVYLQACPQDFEIADKPLRRLTVEPDVDTQPVVFYIKALSLGAKRLTLDFRQVGVTVGTADLEIEVVKDLLLEDQFQTLLDVVQLGGSYAPPPDLEIRVVVREQDGKTHLIYIIHSPNGVAGFHYQPAGESVIRGAPDAYQQHIMQKIEGLSIGKDTDGHLINPRKIENTLEAVGRGLYGEIFSSEMRSAYRRLRESVHTIMITSDEPWIPWELIKPYDDSDPNAVIDDDFLCMQFQVTRWLAGPSGASGRINLSRLACVQAGQVPGYQELPYAQSERQYFSGLAAAFPNLEDASPSPATDEAVKDLLDQGGISLWHFAAHGNVDFSTPNESVLLLSDGCKLCPEDIHGQRQTHVVKDRPLVFLNACRVGQQSWSLIRLGGWAAAWVDRCRCGAFIGPLWSINDRLASEFACMFYDTLREGRTIGQAVQAARQQARDQTLRNNPTWLAYSVYAHPNGRVRFG